MGFWSKTEEQLKAERQVQEEAQKAADLLAERPNLVVNDPVEQERVQAYKAEKKAQELLRAQEVKTLTDRKKLVNNRATSIGDSFESIVQSSSAKHPNLGSTNRPEVQAIREKMQRADSYKGVLGVFKAQKPVEKTEEVSSTMSMRF